MIAQRNNLTPATVEDIVRRLAEEISTLLPLIGDTSLACIVILPAPAETPVKFIRNK